MTHIPLSARVKAAVANGRCSGTVWVHATRRFRVRLEIEPDTAYQYDGDDENGETQAALDNGEFVAFDSAVIVELDGQEIARDTLCGSVYSADTFAEFWTAHRDSDPGNRNCSIMRASLGSNVSICHYFPDMVRLAISEARQHVAHIRVPPKLRNAA
ncbi:hypothetical protein EN780_03310 [Mesorhizobium sp. M4B.F.Ca.ET.089.01.1.1]|uniref:hypothetical protein n=1 Tax=Mesorhizobium sp. M4B.F.Ca.ET.089.01.1.1 TaxID=2496662 RepID=UPI000FE2AA69|nr:hypothetical protein [Mesorhizobium sp. M4B.F.Ca.ET.089.01.1.1]RWX70436.1 hypothetical protein EN780_03310 [Mesorhizobium sp. M4B.F.Ca.ET.089.01.1.1]